MIALIAALAGLFAGAPVPASPLMAECPAAARDQPTLDPRRLPATFRTEIRPIGWQDADTLYLLTGIETATLPSGAKLTVTLSGCESYSNSYAFELNDQAALQDGRHWFEAAAGLMREVEAVSADPPVKFAALQQDLMAQAGDRPAYDFSAGEFAADEYSEILVYNYRVTVERTATATILTVDYWVPL